MREPRLPPSGWILSTLAALLMLLLLLGVVALAVELMLSLPGGWPRGAVTPQVAGRVIAIAMLLGGLAALLPLGRRLAREIAAEIGRLQR